MEDKYITDKDHEALIQLMQEQQKNINEKFTLHCEMLAEEDNRQNQRLANIEKTVSKISDLSESIQKLAINMDNMIKVLDRQGKRLEDIEKRDGDKWRMIVSYVLSTVTGAVVCYALTKIGIK